MSQVQKIHPIKGPPHRKPSPKRAKKGEMIRTQVEFPKDDWEYLDGLQAKFGISSKKEFFINALTLYEWALEEVSAGRIVGSVDKKDETVREVFVPGIRPSRLIAAKKVMEEGKE